MYILNTHGGAGITCFSVTDCCFINLPEDVSEGLTLTILMLTLMLSPVMIYFGQMLHFQHCAAFSAKDKMQLTGCRDGRLRFRRQCAFS